MEFKEINTINNKRLFFAKNAHCLLKKFAREPSTFIACLLLAKDWSKIREDHLRQFLHSLIAGGCVFLGFWGERCESPHDLADELLMLDNPNGKSVPIPTSWEDENLLGEEIWHFVFSYTVDTHLSDECSWLVISLDNDIDYGLIIDLFSKLERYG